MKKKNKRKLPDNIVRAIYRNDIDVINDWQNSDNINDLDSDNRSAIFHAIIAESKDIVDQLLNNSPDLNLKDGRGWYPLHYASQQYLIDIAELLINMGAEIEAKDDYGNTPLWRATFSSNGKGEMIKLLLSKGANPNNENDSGVTPLKLANTIANYDVKQYYS